MSKKMNEIINQTFPRMTEKERAEHAARREAAKPKYDVELSMPVFCGVVVAVVAGIAAALMMGWFA